MGGPGTIDPGTMTLDSNGDGIPDSVEVQLGTDPKVADSHLGIDKSLYTK
jgi:hypothetical protein